MDNRKFEVYTFIAHPKRKPKENVTLEDVYSIDLYEKFKNEFADFVDTFPPDKLEKKTCKIEKIAIEGKTESIFKSKDSMRYISGKIKIGDDDGKEQDVVQNDKDKKLLYTKKKGQSVERPYYFMIVVPLKLKYGYIVLEREGNHSAKKVFESLLKKFISDKLSDLHLKISNFVESEVIREFLEKGEFNKIVLSQKIVSNDKSEQYFGTYINGSKYKVELSIKPLEGTSIPFYTRSKILKNLNENVGFFDAQEFKDIGFDEYSNVKVISTYNGNTRTIDLDDTFKIRPYYNLDVADDTKGFSDFKSINSEAIKLLRSFDLNII